jgi:hypothetical protein
VASEAEDESREKTPPYQRCASLRQVQPGYPEHLVLALTHARTLLWIFGHIARAWDRVVLRRAIDARIFARELVYVKLETRSLEMALMAENICIHVVTITTELRLARSDLAKESLKGIARLLEARGKETYGFILRGSGFRLSYPQTRHDILLQGELGRTCSPVIEFITETNSFIRLATSHSKLSHQLEDGLYLCRHLDRLAMMLKPMIRNIYNFIDVLSYWNGRRL